MRTLEAPPRLVTRANALRTICTPRLRTRVRVDMRTYWRTRLRYLDDLEKWLVVDHDLTSWHGLAIWPAECGTTLYTDTLVTSLGSGAADLARCSPTPPWVRVAAQTYSPPIVGCRTQDPMVMRMMRQFTNTTYPRSDGCTRGRRYERAVEAARLDGPRRAPAPRPHLGRSSREARSPARSAHTCPAAETRVFDASPDRPARGGAVCVIG